MTIAVTGASGQLGSELCRVLGDRAIPLSRQEMDLCSPDAIRHTLLELKPSVVINSAAWTTVDKAESEPDAAAQVNAEAVKAIADACLELDAVLVQISTDYVFGAAGGTSPWRESDPTLPTSVYARTKFSGEQNARTWHKHYIVRTCGLYSSVADGPVRGRNFVDTMLSLGSERDELSVVYDQRCTPTYVPHLVKAIQFLVDTGKFGTYHITNQGDASWIEFASEVFRQAGVEMNLNPISTADYGLPAARPSYSVLDGAKYHALGGPSMPHWTQGLSDYLRCATSATTLGK